MRRQPANPWRARRRIGDKIEYSPTTIYIYFKDKAELLEQVCEETFSKLAQKLSKIMSGLGTLSNGRKTGWLRLLSLGWKTRINTGPLFMMSIPEAFHREKHHRMNSPRMQGSSFLTRRLTDCIRAGKMRAVNVRLAAQTLWAGIPGVTARLITHPIFPWAGREKLILCNRRYAPGTAGRVARGKFFFSSVNGVQATSSVTFCGRRASEGRSAGRAVAGNGEIRRDGSYREHLKRPAPGGPCTERNPY